EEALFSTNDPNSFATSVCPGGVESSFVEGSGLPCDVLPDCDHGTHVAGIAVGNGQDGAVAPFSGVAKGAKLMAVQIFTMISNSLTCSSFSLPSPCALAFTSDIMAGLQRVFNRRAALNFAAVNMSLGGGRFDSNCDVDPLKPIIDSLRSADIATVDQRLSALQGAGVPVTDARNSITKPRIRILNALGQAPVVQFDSATYSVDENGGSATITVTRSGVLSGVLTVRYATSNGTATAPADYTAKSGTLTFNAGVTLKTFTIPIINDTLDESDETVNLTLCDPTGGGALGTEDSGVMPSIGRDSGGVLQFSSATYSVNEGV